MQSARLFRLHGTEKFHVTSPGNGKASRWLFPTRYQKAAVLITKGMIWEKLLFFLSSGFSFTDTDDSQDSREGRGPSFIPLYHFHPLTNIEIFICNFACEMTIAYFYRNACVYQTANRWDLPPYRITIWVVDWWCNVCLFTW